MRDKNLLELVIGKWIDDNYDFLQRYASGQERWEVIQQQKIIFSRAMSDKQAWTYLDDGK